MSKLNMEGTLNDKTKRVNKKLELQELAEVLDQYRANSKKIVHCHGVFDLLHVGHLRHFKAAKKI